MLGKLRTEFTIRKIKFSYLGELLQDVKTPRYCAVLLPSDFSFRLYVLLGVENKGFSVNRI